MLDDRARHAAREVNQAVAEADLLLFESGIPALRQTPVVVHHRSRVLVFAGAFAAVLLFIGLTLAPGRFTAPDNTEGDVATGQTAPSPDGSVGDVVPGPDGTEVDNGPGTTLVAADLTAPTISVTSPADGAEFTGAGFGDDVPLLEFKGMAEPGATVIARTGVEPEPSVTANHDGEWSISLILQAGTNPIRFSAVDAAGNATDVTITVTYTPDTASTTTTTAPAEEMRRDLPDETEQRAGTDPSGGGDLTAVAVTGEATAEAPRGTFRGSAVPGATITLTSEYGSAETVADSDGQWSVELVFAGAPLDEPFLVTVSDDRDGRVKVEFIIRST